MNRQSSEMAARTTFPNKDGIICALVPQKARTWAVTSLEININSWSRSQSKIRICCTWRSRPKGIKKEPYSTRHLIMKEVLINCKLRDCIKRLTWSYGPTAACIDQLNIGPNPSNGNAEQMEILIRYVFVAFSFFSIDLLLIIATHRGSCFFMPASLKLSMHLANWNEKLFKITTITTTMICYKKIHSLCKHLRFMARLRGKNRQRINRNHTEVIQHPTCKIRRRKRPARGKAKIQNLALVLKQSKKLHIWFDA